MLLLANSLIDGFFGSNLMGQWIVLLQLFSSVLMVACIIGKSLELSSVKREVKRFLNDFASYDDVIGYYVKRRPHAAKGIVALYKDTCERLMRIVEPDLRERVARGSADSTPIGLSAREIELVRGTCEHRLDEEEIFLERRMSTISTIVAIAPMMGLLGTVWGVLDAFAEMGTAGSANLATIAPSISAALVTTVVGLLVAFPGIIAYNCLTARIRSITSDFEGFADELTTRIACEFQGKAA